MRPPTLDLLAEYGASVSDSVCVEAGQIEFRRFCAGMADPHGEPLALTTASPSQRDPLPAPPHPAQPHRQFCSLFAEARAIDSLRMCCGVGALIRYL